MFLLNASAKSSKDCLGSSNIPLKKLCTAPKLFTIKFTKSLNAIETTSNDVAKKSAAF